MNWLPTLTWWQWGILAAVPPAIVLLYFLKLKRLPLEVPSTYLWTRAIEDLHVNTIWQRLRQSLLLFLQLLLIAIVAFACLRPGWRGAQLTGNRFIFLIDTSASMSATDVEPNRLADAKKQVLSLVDQMKSGDVAMVISFSDIARIEQPFSDSRRLIRQHVEQIVGTNRPSDLGEALRAAAGLANPGRSGDASAGDVPAAEALPATLYIFSDGGFESVPTFSLGNLTPKYIPIGEAAPKNVALISFTAERNLEKLDQTQAFCNLQNSGPEDATVELSLYLGKQLVDASSVKVPAGGTNGVQFDLKDIDDGELRIEIVDKDHLLLDNTAHAALSVPRRAKVLLVTPGNEALKLALSTDEAVKLAEVAFTEPKTLETQAYQDQAESAVYDLIIYDQCVPPKMPQANTLFIGRVPPLKDWSAGEKTGPPIIIDTDRVHPLMQMVELGNVRFIEGFAVKPPESGRELISTDIGSLFSIAARRGFEDAVLGAEIVSKNEKGQTEVNTDWPIRRSFPTFMMNVLGYLGGSRGVSAMPSVKPGNSIVLRSSAPVKSVKVTSPTGKSETIANEGQNTFVFNGTTELGLYHIHEGDAEKPTQQFAVNLFDTRESNLVPRPAIELGHEEVKGKRGLEPKRKEAWRWIVMLGLAVLVFEWYVYNRRVYL